jgi:hypothetical protein
LKRIATALDIRFDFDGVRLISGERVIMDQLRAAQQRDEPGTNVNLYRQAACRVSEAARLGRSIDVILDQHDDNPKIKLAGKLGIASEILKSERTSDLNLGDEHHDRMFDRLRDTWLAPFSQILTHGFRRSNLEDLFANATVISFNYDRTLEAFIPLSLERIFGIDRDWARRLARRLKVIHPYGSLGSLPWENQPGALPFGAQVNDLEPVAERIRTFTEQLEDPELQEAIATATTEADRVVFLGFGFHRQNVELLKPRAWNGRTMIGTVHGMPSPAVKAAAEMVARAFGVDAMDYQLEIEGFADQKCFPFLEDRFLLLTAP